jgi:hypothetical protein
MKNAWLVLLLLAAPLARAQVGSSACAYWNSVLWNGSFTLTGRASGTAGDTVITEAYSASGNLDFNKFLALCPPPGEAASQLRWISTVTEATNSWTSTATTPCSAGGPPSVVTITSSGAGPQAALLAVDYTQRTYQLIPMLSTAERHLHIENAGCLGFNEDIDLGGISIGLINPAGYPSFSLPASLQTLSQTEFPFPGQGNSLLPGDWKLTFQLIPRCIVPEGEITDFAGWFTVVPPGSPTDPPSFGAWLQTVIPPAATPITFEGRKIQEINSPSSFQGGIGAFMTCDQPGISGGTWTIDANQQWYNLPPIAPYDYVGYPADVIFALRRSGKTPCGTPIGQQMQMLCPIDNVWQNYGKVNLLYTGVTINGITSSRAGKMEFKKFP